MNWKNRALCSIKQNHKKSLLLFLTTIVLGTVLSGVVSLSQEMYNIADNLEDSMVPVVTFQANWESYLEFSNERGDERVDDLWWRLPISVIREIGELPQVRTFNYVAHMMLYNSNLQHYEIQAGDEGVVPVRVGMSCEEIGEPFHLRGVSGSAFIDFEENLIEIVAGRFFTSDELKNTSNIALVSEGFAHLNHLTIGSPFVLKNIWFDFPDDVGVVDGPFSTQDRVIAKREHELKVVGIFRPKFNPISEGISFESFIFFELLNNQIYTSNRFIEMVAEDMFDYAFANDVIDMERMEEVETVEDMVWYRHLFALESPRYISDFYLVAQDKIPPYFYLIDTNNRMRGVLAAIDSMQQLARVIIISSFGAFVLVLTLIIMLFMRDRKKEFGIYLTLGEKKINIIGQIMVEVMTVAIVAILASLFIGHTIAANVSHALWLNDIANMQAQDDVAIWNELIGQGFAHLQEPMVASLVEGHKMVLDFQTILSFLGISIGAMLFAIVTPMINLFRNDPKKIMM